MEVYAYTLKKKLRMVSRFYFVLDTEATKIHDEMGDKSYPFMWITYFSWEGVKLSRVYIFAPNTTFCFILTLSDSWNAYAFEKKKKANRLKILFAFGY